MSFAVGELGLRLCEFYDMPWCEYLIKSKAYHRMEVDKMRHTRFIAYHAYIAPHIGLKKIPTIEQFLKIDGLTTIEKASESTRQQFLEEAAEYYKNKRQA